MTLIAVGIENTGLLLRERDYEAYTQEAGLLELNSDNSIRAHLKNFYRYILNRDRNRKPLAIAAVGIAISIASAIAKVSLIATAVSRR